MRRAASVWGGVATIAGLWLILSGGAAVAVGPGANTAAPALTPEQIEADWLRQDAVRWLPPSPRARPETNVTTRQDAAGGCDGQKTGTYGFHTGGSDPKPWWQVDLGRSMPLAKIVVYNRGDGEVERRHGE
jgi:hypothetical protein